MTRPVRLEPYELDWSESARVFWGASLSLRRWRQLQAEGHALRLDESGETVTERRLTTLGGRLYKNPRPGDPDYELETARQVGTSQGLDHDAFLVHPCLERVPDSPSTPDSDYFTVGFEVGSRLLAR